MEQPYNIRYDRCRRHHHISLHNTRYSEVPLSFSPLIFALLPPLRLLLFIIIIIIFKFRVKMHANAGLVPHMNRCNTTIYQPHDFFPSFFVLCCCFCSKRNPNGILSVHVSPNTSTRQSTGYTMWLRAISTQCRCAYVCQMLRKDQLSTLNYTYMPDVAVNRSHSFLSHGWYSEKRTRFLLLRCVSPSQMCICLCIDSVGYQQCAKPYGDCNDGRNSLNSSELLINNPLCPMNRLVLYLEKL